MQTEVEVKFLDIEPDQLRAKLRQIGARLVTSERIMRRRNFDSEYMTQNHAWVRVRDEGGHITMTYKQTNDDTITGTQEVNLVVNDFDSARAFLSATGLIEKSYQETKRESWELDEVQIEIDSWPWLPAFVELEGPTESKLRDIARQLNFDWDNHLAGDVTAVYQRHYDFKTSDLYHLPIVFGPTPDWLTPKETSN